MNKVNKKALYIYIALLLPVFISIVFLYSRLSLSFVNFEQSVIKALIQLIRIGAFSLFDFGCYGLITLLLIKKERYIGQFIFVIIYPFCFLLLHFFYSYFDYLPHIKRLMDMQHLWDIRAQLGAQVFNIFNTLWLLIVIIFLVVICRKRKFFHEHFSKISDKLIFVLFGIITMPLILILLANQFKGMGIREARLRCGDTYAVRANSVFLIYIDQIIELATDKFNPDSVKVPPPGAVNGKDKFNLKSQKVRDVALIQVESLDRGAVQYQFANGDQLMPFFNQLKKDSLYFNDFYTHHNGGGSSNAEFATLLSIIPTRDHNGFVSLDYEAAPSLNQLLAEHNYASYFFHANKGSFFERTQVYTSMKFDRFYDEKSYSAKAKGWHSKDKDFFKQSIQKVKDDLENENKAKFLYFVTMQTHGPFTNYDSSIAKKLSIYPKFNQAAKLEKDYLASMSDLDKALEYFVKKLKLELNDPIIFIYSDHNSGVLDRPNKGIEKIPFLIHGLSNLSISESIKNQPASLMDIAPTVAYLLGKEPSREWIGNNLLQVRAKQKVIFINGDVIEKLEGNESIQRRVNNEEQVFINYSESLQF